MSKGQKFNFLIAGTLNKGSFPAMFIHRPMDWLKMQRI